MNMNSLILNPSFVPTYYLCKNTSKFAKTVVSEMEHAELLEVTSGTEQLK